LFSALFVTNCSKLKDDDYNDPVGGEPLTQMQEGYESIISSNTPLHGVKEASAKIVSVKGDLANVSAKAVITNPVLKSIARQYSDFWPVQLDRDTVKVDFSGRVTTKGIQYEVNGKVCTLVRYKDDVGTEYTSEIDGDKYKIVYKSTTDDYQYTFWMLKIYKVEQKINLNGSQVKVYYYTNHKYGLVGFEIHYEDGTVDSAIIL